VTAMRRALLVAAGAALGGLFRVVLAVLLPLASSDPALAAPGLLVVNVTGSLLAGFLRGLGAGEHHAGRNAERMDALMVVGFCGGYTSYSAFVASLHEGVAGNLPWTVALAAATLLLCPLAAALGMRASTPRPRGYPPRPAAGAESARP
jgi:CrcB protein